MSLSLHPLVRPRNTTTILLLMGFALLWMGMFFVLPTPENYKLPSALVKIIGAELLPNLLITNILSLAFTMFNALLIYWLNNKFTIIRTRSSMPVFVYLLLMTLWHKTHYVLYPHLALAIMIISLFVFFGMYRLRRSPERAFLGTLLLSVGSLIVEPIALFIPVFWINFIHYNCFSFRNFLASLIGLLLPWIFFFWTNYHFSADTGWLSAIVEPFRLKVFFLQGVRPATAEIVYIAGIALLYTVAHFCMLAASKADSLQTRAKLQILFYLGLASALFTLCFGSQDFIFLPFVAFSYAILFSHPVTLEYSKFNRLLFLVFLVINLLYLARKIWLAL
jgi:hypothetical protein